MSDWTNIESDPGVFTELINKFGTKGVEVAELWSIGDDDFAPLKPVYGLIFLFKWVQEEDNRPVDMNPDTELFFAKQVITNACATQAILSILMNSPEIDLGSTLTDFKSFVGQFPSDLKGEAISNMNDIRVAHNSFARPEPFFSEDDKRAATKDDDVYHFIAYIPFKGKVYELDGLKPGPIMLGEIVNDDWLATVRPHIEQRINKYSGSEIRFNLMALIKDRRMTTKEAISKCEQRVAQLNATISSLTEADAQDAPVAPAATLSDGDFDALLKVKNFAKLSTQLSIEQNRRQELQLNLRDVEDKYQSWRDENVRRKHNYVPFAVNLLKILAEKQLLKPMVDKAVAKRETRAAEAANKKAKQ